MLYEKANKLVEEANELKDFCLSKMLDPDMIKVMDEEEFKIFKKTYKLMEDSIDLVLEQSKLFDEMDNKLDKIMKKLEA